uniref:Uncharacterized protein n=1 Tax=Anguilla anguilla TaxID=7936 RepID=A0A0E9QR69_ANGAN
MILKPKVCRDSSSCLTPCQKKN